jgi:cobalt-zinc-cadmium efflux system membrane fusion protein
VRHTAAIALAAILAGCSGNGPAKTEAKADAPAEEKLKSGEVIMTEPAQKMAGITVELLQPGIVSESITATGELTVNEERTWTVGSHIEGRVVTVFAKPGDHVRQGAVLARMHSHEVHDSRADFRRASDELVRARAAALQATRLRDRAARLFELKAASKQDLELAEGQRREAEVAVRNAQTELDRVRTHITDYLEVSVSPGNEDRGEDHIPIKTPESGQVIERKASAGTVVTTGQEMFRITDPSSVWMMANVSESDLRHLRVGQSVRVIVRAYPDRPFPGRILRLGEALDPTTRTLKVRVLVPNRGGLLKPEMYATAEIERAGSRSALFVPEAAAQDLSGNRVVFVRTGPDRFEARPIQVARVLDGRMEVVEGLRSGEEVVVRGSFILKSQLLRSSMEQE